MKKNIGLRDRMARVFIATVLLIAYFSDFEKGIFGLVCLSSGILFIISAMLSYCPFYAMSKTSSYE